MNLYNAYKTDTVKETEGVWYEIPDCPNEDGSIPKFKLARLTVRNKKYLAACEAHAPLVTGKKESEISEDEARKYNVSTFVDGVVTEFENVPKADGSFVKTHGELIGVLCDLPDLYAELEKFCQMRAVYREKELGEAAKN
jgi:hypothetical protein